MITASDLRKAGYKVSSQITDEEVERAAIDVATAYLAPFADHYEPKARVGIKNYRGDVVFGDDDPHVIADDMPSGDNIGYYSFEPFFYSAVFLLLLQRGGFATRSGARTPNITSASQMDGWEIIGQASKDAAAYWDGAVNGWYYTGFTKEMFDEVRDICGIWFKSQYFYI